MKPADCLIAQQALGLHRVHVRSQLWGSSKLEREADSLLSIDRPAMDFPLDSA